MPAIFRITLVNSVIVLACLMWSGAAVAVPQINHPVVDRAGVLTGSEVDRISDKLFAHHEATGVQMAVLFVDSTGEIPIEDYSLEVAEEWEGGHAERDDGILLVFAIDDRRNRLELGYGIEPLISDSQAAQMLDAVTGELRASHYGDAAEAIVDDVIIYTEHVQPGGDIPDAHSSTRVLIATGIVFLYAMLQGYLWRRLRGELYSDAVEDDDDDDDDDAEDLYARTVKWEPGKVFDWVVTVVCWVPPPLFIFVYFGDGQIPANWEFVGTSLASTWLIAVWGLTSVLAAFLAKYIGVIAFFIIMFVLFHIPTGFGLTQWLETSTGSQRIIMLTVGLNGYIWIWVIIFMGVVVTSLDGSGGGSSFSSGGMSSSGAGGGFSGGGGGGFSGGGGSFGGGGASGGW